VFGAAFLCRLTIADTQCLLDNAEERGFLGMLESIYCMYWQWHKAWPIYMGDIKHPTIILEAISSHGRWIVWHAFFGFADSNNNINMLNESSLFIDVIRGHSPEVSFTVNGREHHMRYSLCKKLKWETHIGDARKGDRLRSEKMRRTHISEDWNWLSGE
jgi:hypothetical protein